MLSMLNSVSKALAFDTEWGRPHSEKFVMNIY